MSFFGAPDGPDSNACSPRAYWNRLPCISRAEDSADAIRGSRGKKSTDNDDTLSIHEICRRRRIVVQRAIDKIMAKGFRRRLVAAYLTTTSAFSAIGPSVRVYDGVFSETDCDALSTTRKSSGHSLFSRRRRASLTELEVALDSVLCELGDDSEWVEYWSRAEWKHIEAHADVDEKLAATTGELRCPKMAHVLTTNVGSKVYISKYIYSHAYIG
jgi:hypothetical protein